MSTGTGVAATRPLRHYVLKVHSRCDLRCDHCYIYRHADQTWRTRPRAMAPETVRAAAERITEHAREHRLPTVNLILHGGEPLLLGPVRLRRLLHRLRTTIDPVAKLDLRLQTNGVRLSPTLCDLFDEYDVRVGISLDGDAQANDLHRRFDDGRSSHAQVRRALRLLRAPEYRHLYAGILCTVDLRNDPIQVYRALVAEEPPGIDFLLPHATWSRPPPRPGGAATPYADWLSRIHRQWTGQGRPTRIRLFDSLLAAAAAGNSGTEAVGLDPVDVLVVETDGAWELPDSMKTAFHEAAATRMDVFRHSVREVAAHPGIAGRPSGLAGLCRTCQECPVVHQCGGGLRAHRYRVGSGFDNPSVYCADLRELVDRVNKSPPPAPVARSVPREPSGDPPPVDRPDRRLLDGVAGGYGAVEDLTWLATRQLGMTRADLVLAAERLADGGAAAAWRLLCELDGVAPDAVERVLNHPYVHRWARRSRHRATPTRPLGGGPDGPDGRPARHAFFASLAATAAVHAGVDVELPVPVRAGMLYLPGLGAVVWDDPAVRTARLSTTARGVTVRAGDHTVSVRRPDGGATPDGSPWSETMPDAPPGRDVVPDPILGPDGSDGMVGTVGVPAGAVLPPRWLPARWPAAPGWRVHLDDIDPLRDCYEWPATGRLTAAEAASWQRSIIGAWAALGRDVPAHLPAMRAMLRVVTPLRADPAGRLRSGTARDAFGAIGAVAATGDQLAVLLVHEFQHLKLGAILDLCPLVDPDAETLLPVPWRPDPRPCEGVLQGTYAHLAIADVWRARPGRQAGDQHRRYRAWTEKAADALLGSGSLTPAGERFVRRMRETTERWSAG